MWRNEYTGKLPMNDASGYGGGAGGFGGGFSMHGMGGGGGRAGMGQGGGGQMVSLTAHVRIGLLLHLRP